MINMLKNKAVVGLFIIMLGFTYIKGTDVKTMEENKQENVVYTEVSKI